jgi:hypothetical protein
MLFSRLNFRDYALPSLKPDKAAARLMNMPNKHPEHSQNFLYSRFNSDALMITAVLLHRLIAKTVDELLISSNVL